MQQSRYILSDIYDVIYGLRDSMVNGIWYLARHLSIFFISQPFGITVIMAVA